MERHSHLHYAEVPRTWSMCVACVVSIMMCLYCLVTLLVFFFSSASSMVFWVFGISTAIVCAHAAVYAPPADPLDFDSFDDVGALPVTAPAAATSYPPEQFTAPETTPVYAPAPSAPKE